MKKTYESPMIEVLQVKTQDLMETSLGVYDTEITKEDMLSPEGFDFNFED